ncbi:MAG: HPr family phosphocarrier protein [Lachnospiraceae bacterium]
MHEIAISLNSIDRVKNFVAITTKFDTDIDLVSGRYVIDAKSIMGIFSMDLSKPIILRIYEDVEEKATDIINELSEYVKEEN